MVLFRRLMPFSTFGGAAWFAFKHRRPLWDWGTWSLRSVPRVASGDLGDVLTEARLRRRLHGDRRTGADAIDVEVVDGRARLRGEVAPGGRAVATELARDAGGIDVVENELREREAEPARG